MNNTIFLISLVDDGVHAGKSIIGYANSNDKEPIADSIKKYNLILGEQLMNKFSFQNGCHWEYQTNKMNVEVHVDVIYKIKEPYDE